MRNPAGSDKRLQCNELQFGAQCPDNEDTLNRLTLVGHNNDGTHKIESIGDALYCSSAPADPLDGLLVYADGAGWDPGLGAGFYRYSITAGAWLPAGPAEGSVINGAAAKTTPADADNVPITDSAASHILKKVTWANIKATLKTYFDAIYATGPASATDNALVRYDGATGRLLQDSGVLVDDSGNVLIGVSALVQNYAGFKYVAISGSTLAGILELSSQAADADAVNLGSLRWADKNASDADKSAGAIQVNLQGTTANDRGSKMRFFVKADGGALTERMNLINAGDLVLSKTSGIGIKVDITTPTFGWRDMLAHLRPDTGGANSPTLAAFRGGLTRQFFYSANDKMDMDFHIPHDYAPGTDIFIHIHWGHNGTAISGNFVVNFAHTYAKGHNQEIFPAEKTVTMTYATVNVATTPRWIHRIDEVQLSSSGGSATLMDTALLEPDGIISVNMTVTTIPTITGGTTNEPAIIFADIHYQSTNMPTKQKAPNFYV